MLKIGPINSSFIAALNLPARNLIVSGFMIAMFPACSTIWPGSIDNKEPENSTSAADKPAPGKTQTKLVITSRSEPDARDPDTISLFDGKTLGDWTAVQFGGEGEVFVTEKGELQFDFGALMTGVVWKKKPPPATSNYEISLEAMKLQGNDFFCGLTFPVKESHCSFIAGGWGGGIIGISSIDDLDASENETMNIEGFEDNRWYKIRVRVTDPKVEVWLDDKQFVDLELKDKKISVRPGDIELCIPLGLCSFQTRAQYRNITWKKIKPQAPR